MSLTSMSGSNLCPITCPIWNFFSKFSRTFKAYLSGRMKSAECVLVSETTFQLVLRQFRAGFCIILFHGFVKERHSLSSIRTSAIKQMLLKPVKGFMSLEQLDTPIIWTAKYFWQPGPVTKTGFYFLFFVTSVKGGVTLVFLLCLGVSSLNITCHGCLV